jgi:hypothetical protein
MRCAARIEIARRVEMEACAGICEPAAGKVANADRSATKSQAM